MDVIDTQTWGSESQLSISTLCSSSLKDESGREGPTAGPFDNHNGATFRRLRRSYGAGTADRTNIATASGGDVNRGILSSERYAGPAGPMMDPFATMCGVTPEPLLADGRDARRAYDTAKEDDDFILVDGEVEL